MKDSDDSRYVAAGMASTSNIAMGLLMSVVAIPVIVGDLLYATSKEAKGPLAYVVTVSIAVFFIALPLHFFVGHRIKWILPVLLVMLGMVSVWAGIVGPDIMLIAIGVACIGMGIGWNSSSTSANPVSRWIAGIREYLTQDASNK